MPSLTGSAPLPVEKLVRLRGEAGSIISKGLYAYHLREWLEYYDPLQLKVLLFEDFYKNVCPYAPRAAPPGLHSNNAPARTDLTPLLLFRQ